MKRKPSAPSARRNTARQKASLDRVGRFALVNANSSTADTRDGNQPVLAPVRLSVDGHFYLGRMMECLRIASGHAPRPDEDGPSSPLHRILVLRLHERLSGPIDIHG